MYRRIGSLKKLAPILLLSGGANWLASEDRVIDIRIFDEPKSVALWEKSASWQEDDNH
jgi:hypothetical protein